MCDKWESATLCFQCSLYACYVKPFRCNSIPFISRVDEIDLMFSIIYFTRNMFILHEKRTTRNFIWEEEIKYHTKATDLFLAIFPKRRDAPYYFVVKYLT